MCFISYILYDCDGYWVGAQEISNQNMGNKFQETKDTLIELFSTNSSTTTTKVKSDQH